MRQVKINKVIAVSSQDKNNPAESLINNETDSVSASSKWLSSPSDKTQHIEAEFMFEEAAVIRCIEIGNWGSSSIEILAKNTTGRFYPSYVTLLPSATLRTLEDSKSNINFDVKRIFTEEQFAKEAVGRKFNQVKVICGQPYAEPLQYGLSFLNFEADDNIQLHYTTADFYAGQSIPSLLERVMANTATPKTYSSRGRQMVDVALSHTNNASSSISSASETPTVNDNGEPFDFSLTVTLFLTDPAYSKKSAQISVNELIRLFERKNKMMLIDTQKDEFHQIYSSLFSQANIFPESPKSLPSEGFSTPVNSSTPSMTSSGRKRGKHVPCNNTQLSNGDDQENSKDYSYDVDFTPKKKARSCQKALFNSNNNPSSGSQTVITLDGDDDTPSAFGSSYRPQDFIQSDGSVPSTSKAVSFVDCPICAQEFHVSDIEKHAATCENFKPHGVDSDDDDDESTSALYNQTVYCAYRSGTKC